jgi:hypothetical protein
VASPYVIPLSWRNVLLVVAGAVVLWLLPWAAALRMLTPPRPAARGPVPVIRYVRALQGAEGAAWSPVLIPLPTRWGFSKEAALEGTPRSLVEVLKPVVSEPVFMALKPEAPSRETQALEGLLAGEFTPGAEPLAFAAETGSPPGPELQVELADTLRARGYAAPGLTRQRAPAGRTVEAYVELDPRGRVSHVFVEGSSGSAKVDAAVARELRAGGGNPGKDRVSGLVRIRARGPGAGEKE